MAKTKPRRMPLVNESGRGGENIRQELRFLIKHVYPLPASSALNKVIILLLAWMALPDLLSRSTPRFVTTQVSIAWPAFLTNFCGMVIERTVGGGLSPDLTHGLTAIGG